VGVCAVARWVGGGGGGGGGSGGDGDDGVYDLDLTL